MNNEEHRFYVYGLFEDGYDLPFYIGKGTGDRYLRSAKDIKSKTHKSNKIKKLISEGKSVNVIKLVDNLIEIEALLLEVELIKEFGRISNGGVLVNHTDGGDGSSGYKHTEGSKKKISESQKGKLLSSEHIEKLRIASTGRTWSNETRKKLQDFKSRENHHMFGKNHSEETKLKMSKSQSGKVLSKEHINNIKESNKKRFENNENKKFKGNNPNSKKLIAKGINFDCISDAAEYLKVNRITISRRIKNDNLKDYYLVLDINPQVDDIV